MVLNELLILLLIVASNIWGFELVVDDLHMIGVTCVMVAIHCVAFADYSTRHYSSLRDRRWLHGGCDSYPAALLFFSASHEVSSIFFLVGVILIWRGARIIVVVRLVVEALRVVVDEGRSLVVMHHGDTALYGVHVVTVRLRGSGP